MIDLGTQHSQQMTPAEWEEHAVVNNVHAKKVWNLDAEGNLINPNTEETQLQVQSLLETIKDTLNLLSTLASTKGIASDVRTTLLSGTLTTLTTLTSMTNIAGLSAINVVPNLQNLTAIQSNINNISRE